MFSKYLEPFIILLLISFHISCLPGRYTISYKSKFPFRSLKVLWKCQFLSSKTRQTWFTSIWIPWVLLPCIQQCDLLFFLVLWTFWSSSFYFPLYLYINFPSVLTYFHFLSFSSTILLWPILSYLFHLHILSLLSLYQVNSTLSDSIVC